MIKGSIQQEDITSVNIYSPIMGASKVSKKKEIRKIREKINGIEKKDKRKDQ